MGFEPRKHRLTVYKGFTRKQEIQALQADGVTPLDITGGKAWYAVTRHEDLGSTQLFQYHSSDPPTANVVLNDPAQGKFTITIPASDLAALEAPFEYVWDAAVELASGERYKIIPPNPFQLECTVDDPTAVP